ncbi:porin [Novispirillum sp. DQ9]|uniref:porin n=1 Tax=Novispirillum sp. DQ9 TaxID=3398612 RepID=UPI003C7B7983
MKKLLIGTSALVAAGLVAGAAHAADPIKLNIGGFAGTWVAYADQDEGFLGTTETTAVDVKGDAEVIFTGSTTLDNGLKVSFKSEMEAGGRDKNAAGATNDAIDEYNISVAGSFGTVMMGADDTALAAIAVTSPRVGGRLYGGAFSEGDNVIGANVLAPGGIAAPNATFVNTGGDSESISYISPSFAGFTVGATYMPDAGQVDDNFIQPNGLNTTDAYGVGAAYNGEFSGVGIKVAGGWLTGDVSNQTAVAVSTIDDYNEYQFGANLSYAGFTFGGGMRFIDQDFVGGTEADAFAWDLGLSYKTGPYGVSLAYFDSVAANALAGIDEDRRQVWELNGEYTMGPGVALVGGLAHVSFENGVASGAPAAVRAANENDGWVATTGITLSF